MIRSSFSNGSSRRKFIKKISKGVAASLSIPSLNILHAADLNSPNQLADSNIPHNIATEEYWKMVKGQFTSPNDLLMVNTANLSPSPYFIEEGIDELSERLNKDVSFQHRAVFREIRQKSLKKISSYLGIAMSEIGITRNTSESNNIIVNGLDFKAGDEIILWDQNHPTNREAWRNRAKRMGFVVREVSTPIRPEGTAELLDTFTSAINSKTRLIAFSHISNVSGIALPVREICEAAKSKGILTLIDGAQAFGYLNLNLKELGCDFYTSSCHKWLMGPIENGILYISKDKIPNVWPNIIGAGWQDTYETVDQKYCVLGQRNNPSTATLGKIIDFHQTIGKDNIESRVRELNQHLKNQLQQKIPQIQFVTPTSADLSAGIVIINIPNKNHRELFDSLYREYGIACAPTGGVRFSANINTVISDMDYIVDSLVDLIS